MSIRYTERALAQLAEIFEYVANSNPDGAYKVHSEIKTAISRLEAFPFIGRVTDRPGVRVLAVVRYPYKVFYRVLRRWRCIDPTRHAYGSGLLNHFSSN